MTQQLNPVLEWPTGKLDFSCGCIVMGVLNVTPDSFSDGGKFLSPENAIRHGLEMAKAGAAIIDIGPESTRPGSRPVPTAEQLRRAIPVIETLRKYINTSISIDTFDPKVAETALAAGANIIDDITAFSSPKMAQLTADRQVPVNLMHMKGVPATMQRNPHYDDVVAEVKQFLVERAKYAESFGIPKERIFIDPGFGFGKTTEHNLSLLNHLDELVQTGYRVLVGTSRKHFIGKITGKNSPAERLFGTAATVALTAQKGAAIVRVHDVAEMMDVVKVINAITHAE